MGLPPEVADGVGVSLPSAGHVIAAYALGVVLGAPVLAGLGARVPRSQLLVALIAAFALGNVLSALAPSYPLPASSPACPTWAPRRSPSGAAAG